MREYQRIDESTLTIPSDQVYRAFQALQKECDDGSPEQMNGDLLTLLKDQFGWEGVLRADGSIVDLCPIEKERISHEDWSPFLDLLAPFLQDETSLDFTDHDERTNFANSSMGRAFAYKN